MPTPRRRRRRLVAASTAGSSRVTVCMLPPCRSRSPSDIGRAVRCPRSCDLGPWHADRPWRPGTSTIPSTSGTTARIRASPASCRTCPATNPDQPPMVWTIDEVHAPLLWFPRDCPRITFWIGGRLTRRPARPDHCVACARHGARVGRADASVPALRVPVRGRRVPAVARRRRLLGGRRRARRRSTSRRSATCSSCTASAASSCGSSTTCGRSATPSSSRATGSP